MEDIVNEAEVGAYDLAIVVMGRSGEIDRCFFGVGWIDEETGTCK